jgi:hypothetical protein
VVSPLLARLPADKRLAVDLVKVRLTTDFAVSKLTPAHSGLCIVCLSVCVGCRATSLPPG